MSPQCISSLKVDRDCGAFQPFSRKGLQVAGGCEQRLLLLLFTHGVEMRVRVGQHGVNWHLLVFFIFCIHYNCSVQGLTWPSARGPWKKKKCNCCSCLFFFFLCSFFIFLRTRFSKGRRVRWLAVSWWFSHRWWMGIAAGRQLKAVVDSRHPFFADFYTTLISAGFGPRKTFVL